MIPGPERILGWTRHPRVDELDGRLRDFVRFLLIHLAVRDWIRVIDGSTTERLIWAVTLSACALAALHPRAVRAASGAAFAVLTWKLALLFPGNSNHFLIEYLCVGFACGVGLAHQQDRDTLGSGLRWLAVLVLFWSGLNKLIYGTYFNGAFLASVMQTKAFAAFFGLLLPVAEMQSLLEAEPPGPYRFSSAIGLLISNGVYLGEMAAALLLLIPRARKLGVLLAIGVLVGIESGARELLFGTLLLNLLLLFVPGAWGPRVLGASLGFYALLVALRLGGVEGFN